MKQLDFFLLNHRIFLVKHFYQFNGDCLCVKTKYESKYKNESPVFSSDILMEIVSLFEQTGSVFKPLEATCEQIEQVYVKVESPEELPAREIEDRDCLQSPVQDSTQINPFYNSGSDICDSSQENTSNADTLSNEEFPLTPGFGNSIQVRERGIPEWWENPDDSLEAEDFKWNQEAKALQYSCSAENCQRTFKSWTSLALHRITHPEDRGEIHKCKKCDKIFLEKYALKRHFRRKHLTVRFKCNKCKCKFREEKNYRNHLEEHEMEPREPDAPDVLDEPVNSPEFKEPVATVKVFQSNQTLESQQKEDLPGEKSIKCPAKGRKKRVERFKTCEVCGKVCSTARYRKHTMTHSGERPIKCNICGKGFIYSCGYQKHLLWHQGIKTGVKRAMCEICGKKLTGEKILEAHIKKIHERPEHEFKCKVSGCGRSYPNEKFLRRHMDRHSGKMFKCSFCDLEYKDKSQLKIHMDKVHLKTEPPLKCELCGKGSWNIKDHRTHMKKLHQIEVPFVRKKPQKNIENIE